MATYHKYIVPSKKAIEFYPKCLKKRILKEDESYTESVTFDDGMVMDVKVCGCQDEPAYTKAVLLQPDEKNTKVLNEACLPVEVYDTFLGEYRIDYGGNTYVCHLVEHMPIEAEINIHDNAIEGIYGLLNTRHMRPCILRGVLYWIADQVSKQSLPKEWYNLLDKCRESDKFVQKVSKFIEGKEFSIKDIETEKTKEILDLVKREVKDGNYAYAYSQFAEAFAGTKELAEVENAMGNAMNFF